MQQSTTIIDWPLIIKIPDFDEGCTKEIRVHGGLHIGGCIIKLINLIQQTTDWSDYALWWPSKKIWLLKTKFTLDQYGLQASDQLIFTHIHKNIRLELPDLQKIEMKINFSINLFEVVQTICKNFGIKHYEELSLLKTATNGEDSEEKIIFDYDPQSLSMSPIVSNIQDKLKLFIKYKNIFDKCRINSYWLDSAKSLMEQDVRENDFVKLKFKYYAFYDLNIKYDLIRINQIYEQAKWSILSEEIDCTDEELITFSALQLQIQIHTKQALNLTLNRCSSSSTSTTTNTNDDHSNNNDYDDVDAALNNLEKSLQENSIGSQSKQQSKVVSASILDLTKTSELCEEMFLMKHKYTFKKLKTYFFVLRDTYISYYKSKSDYTELKLRPIEKYCLKSCEITPDLNVISNKFGIFLKIFQSNEIIDLYLRAFNEDSYSKWLAAIKLASRNKTIDDSNAYKFEIDSVLNLIEMQKIKKPSTVMTTNISNKTSNDDDNQILDDFQVQNFVPQSLLKKFKIKHLTDRIIETHSNLSDLSLVDAKLKFIKSWQALPDYGITYFCVRFRGSKYREEFIGITSTRLIRYGYDFKQIKQWRLNSIKTWYVNWDMKQFDVEFEEEKLQFQCITNLNPKILNEFIGAYVFLSLRNNLNENSLDHDLFYKLTDKH